VLRSNQRHSPGAGAWQIAPGLVPGVDIWRLKERATTSWQHAKEQAGRKTQQEDVKKFKKQYI